MCVIVDVLCVVCVIVHVVYEVCVCECVAGVSVCRGVYGCGFGHWEVRVNFQERIQSGCEGTLKPCGGGTRPGYRRDELPVCV